MPILQATWAVSVVTAIGMIAAMLVGSQYQLTSWSKAGWGAIGASVLGAAIVVAGAEPFSSMPVLFFGHIAAMFLCWFFMTSGSVVYAMTRSWPTQVAIKSRPTVRMVHGVMQSLACAAGVVGYACIFRNHQIGGSSQFGFDKGNPLGKTVHALLGYVVLAFLLLQSFQGWSKYFGLQAGKLKYLLHPRTGKFLLILAPINIVIVLHTFPMLSSVKFGCLSVGMLAASCIAVWSSTIGGKAASRDNQDSPALYEHLSAGGTDA